MLLDLTESHSRFTSHLVLVEGLGKNGLHSFFLTFFQVFIFGTVFLVLGLGVCVCVVGIILTVRPEIVIAVLHI